MELLFNAAGVIRKRLGARAKGLRVFPYIVPD